MSAPGPQPQVLGTQPIRDGWLSVSLGLRMAWVVVLVFPTAFLVSSLGI